MELTTDFQLRGPIWVNTINKLAPLFKTRTNYEIFMLCLAIGIMYDETIPSMDDQDLEPKNVPRNVIQNNDNGKIDLMLKAAILTTKTLNLTEDERLELAFGDKKADDPFNRHDFLLSFANYGVTKLQTCVGESEFESMELIKNFLVNTMAGNNFEVDGISDEIMMELLAEDQDY